jgi:L-threonylcarbamoyladenylate synthase
MISMAQMQAALNLSPHSEGSEYPGSEQSHQAKTVPVVSGSLASHYAPNTPVELVSSQATQESWPVSIPPEKSGLLRLEETRLPQPFLNTVAHTILMPNEPKGYAYRLYEALHSLDQKQLDRIYIELPDETNSAWQGILDRLHRAATPSY